MSEVNAQNIERLLNAKWPYQQLKISGNVKVDIPGKFLPGVKLTIYNEQDEKIWINGQVAIMNAGRALATPEKFQAYEKLNKTYVDEDYNFVNDLLGVNFVDYSALEKMLLGRAFLPIDFEDSALNITDSLIQIRSLSPMVIQHEGKTYSYDTEFQFDEKLNLQKVQIVDNTESRDLIIEYGNRAKFENLNLPTIVKISINDTKPKTITLNYNNFDSNSMDTPFRIPSGYEKRIIQ